MNALARYNYPHQNQSTPDMSFPNQNPLHGPTANQAQGQNMNQNQNTNQGSGPMSPRSTAAAASAYNLDPSILQTTIGSLLQSPAAAQMFLNSLNNSVQGQTLTPLAQSLPNGLGGQSSYPFPQTDTQGQAHQQQQQQFSNQNQAHQDPTLALFSPLPNQDSLRSHSDNLQRSYQGAADMSGDVDKLQESIDSLVRSMGLEPNNNQSISSSMTNPQQSNTAGLGMGAGIGGGDSGMGMGMGMDQNGFDLSGMGGEGFDPGFDVDQFLTELAKSERQIQDQEETKPQV